MRYAKTEAGQQAFKTRSAELTARQRSAFILFDGKKSDQEVLTMTAGLGVSPSDIEHMLARGFLHAAILESEAKSTRRSAPSAEFDAMDSHPQCDSRSRRGRHQRRGRHHRRGRRR